MFTCVCVHTICVFSGQDGKNDSMPHAAIGVCLSEGNNTHQNEF